MDYDGEYLVEFDLNVVVCWWSVVRVDPGIANIILSPYVINSSIITLG